MKIKPKAVLLDGSQNYTQWSRRVTFILTSQKIASIALATTILPAFLSKTSSIPFSHLPQLWHFISCCWLIHWGGTSATTFSTFSTSLPFSTFLTSPPTKAHILCRKVQFSQFPLLCAFLHCLLLLTDPPGSALATTFSTYFLSSARKDHLVTFPNYTSPSSFSLSRTFTT